MPNYRRAYVPGGSYFFTVVTAHRSPILCSEWGRCSLRRVLQDVKRRWPFRIEAMVLLPEHLHAIWTLPRGDIDYSRRWAWIKKEFTRDWISRGGVEQEISNSKREDRRRGVWQRRFWEHCLNDQTDFEQHCDYIHYNPVKHGLVRCPSDWPYSSFHRFVSGGDYPPDWGCASHRPPAFGNLDATAME